MRGIRTEVPSADAEGDPPPVASQAMLEDPTLGALFALLEWLGAGEPCLRSLACQCLTERLNLFLPPDRTERVVTAFLRFDRLSPPGLPESTPHRFSVLVNALEVAACGSPALLERVVRRVRELPGLRRGELDLARAVLDMEAAIEPVDEESDRAVLVLDFGGEEAKWRIPLREPGIRLRAVCHSGHWLVRHELAGRCEVRFNSGRFPTGMTLWLKPRERLYLGDQVLTLDALEFMVAHRQEPVVRWQGWEVPGEFWLGKDLPQTSVSPVARVVYGAERLVIEADDAMLKAGEVVAPRGPVLPDERIRMGAFRGTAWQLMAALSGRERWELGIEGLTVRFSDGAMGLQGLRCRMQSGEMVAVLGPSGCGKSTLLSLLTGAVTATSGSVSWRGNGRREPVVAVVPQDDVVFETLTVEENLRYAGALRLVGKDESARQAAIESVLQRTGLAGLRDRQVGSVVEKVLSGGQRKRLNLGLELTGDPDVLLLDEPTSGLSSSDALELTLLFRQLARDGKLVLAVIHQPSAEVFEHFDKVLVLDEGGKMAYFGTVAEAPAYFAAMAPPEMAAARVGADLMLGTMLMRRKVLGGASAEYRTLPPEFWEVRYAQESGNIAPAVLCVASRTPKPGDVEPQAKGAPLWKTWQWAARVMVRRETLRKWRERRSLLAALGIAAGLALVIALICRNGLPYSFERNENLPGFCFLAVILVQFLALSSSVHEIVRDRALRQRERLLGLPGWTWVAGKLPALGALLAAQATVILLVGVPVLGIPFGWGGLWVSLLLAGACGLGLGLAVSALPWMSERIAAAAVPLLLVPQLVLAGADPFSFDRLRHLNWPLPPGESSAGHPAPPWPAQLMPARWAYQAMICTLRDEPSLLRHREAEDRMGEVNFVRKNLEAATQGTEAFRAAFADKFGRGFDPGRLREDLEALVRGGNRSGEEAEAAMGVFGRGLSALSADRESWVNRIFADYALRTFPLGADAVRHAWQALMVMALAALVSAAGFVHGGGGRTGASTDRGFSKPS